MKQLLTFFNLAYLISWTIWLPLYGHIFGLTDLPTLLTGSILLTWLYNSSRGSILICAVFHSTIDIAFTSGIADKNIVNYMGFLITVWGILTIIIFKPKNLSHNERLRNDYRKQSMI